VVGRIEVRQDGNVTRHILDGEPLEEGTRLQVLLESGVWLDGTYSWSGAVARWPGLRIELGGPVPEGSIRRPMAVMALPPQAMCRRTAGAGATRSDSQVVGESAR
jgi:hypothetical protein